MSDDAGVRLLGGVAGLLIIGIVLWDTFEIILLPRRMPRRLRLSRVVLGGLWLLWRRVARPLPPRAREGLLGTYPILGLLKLLAIWAIGLMVGFALLQFSTGLRLETPNGPPDFATALYYSSTTFFTLGLGDVHPTSGGARLLTAIEAGTGFGFLAMVIAYLPVLYQSFSRREVRVTMLDQWAATPPTAAVVLRRACEAPDPNVIQRLLRDWEQSASDILESHLSYPILAYFRSHHDNQSWLASLTAVLDTCTLVLVGVRGVDPFQARLTFAIARHAAVDLSQTAHLKPSRGEGARASAETLARVRAWLRDAGVPMVEGEAADAQFFELTAMYEPYVAALAEQLMMPLPGWMPSDRLRFNWETTTWAKTVSDEAH